MNEKKINLAVTGSSLIFGLIGVFIGIWGFSNSMETRSKTNLKEIIDLHYETAKLLGAESSGPDSFSLWHVRGQENDKDIDSLQIWKNIRKIEVISEDTESAIGLKLIFISKLTDEKEIERYLDEIGSDLDESAKKFYLGSIISKDRDRIATALNYMEEAVLLDPENIEMRAIYAFNLHSANRDRESIEQFQIAIKIDSSNANLINKLGHVLVESRQFTAAATLLTDAVDNNISDTGTFNVLGYSSTVQGDFEAAKKFFELSIEKDFLNPLPHRNLSLVLQELGDLEGAKKEADLAKKYGWAVPAGADYRSVMD
jgi:tetratricopeptide (TPR) repeat protein